MISSQLIVLGILLSLLGVILYPPVPISFENARALVLTAHPDDECMFFAPTIHALARQDPSGVARTQVYSLCLSTGDGDGLGVIRKEELSRSLSVLDVPLANRALVDHPELKDNITADWDPALIAEILSTYVNKNQITTILTFDEGGVSGHPNHRSLPEGVKYLLTHHTQTLSVPLPNLFVLKTHPIAKKYTGLLSPLYSKIKSWRRPLYPYIPQVLLPPWSDPSKKNLQYHDALENDVAFITIAGIPEYVKALQAMREHWSQLVWFRWLYVLFSRYMWVNEWVEYK